MDTKNVFAIKPFNLQFLEPYDTLKINWRMTFKKEILHDTGQFIVKKKMAAK